MPRLAVWLPLLVGVFAVPLAYFRTAGPTPAPFVEVRPGLWRTRNDFNFIPSPALPTPVAAWLVEGKSSWVLIDAGVNTEAYAPGFKRAVEERLHSSKKELGAILLTHGHLDHDGLLPWLLETYPDVPFAFHEAEQPFLTGGKQYYDLTGDTFQFDKVGKYYMGTKNSSLPASRSVLLKGASGDVGSYVKSIPTGLLTYTHLPGHSPGMLAYLHLSTKSLIAGDSITSMSTTWPFTLSGQSKVDVPFLAPTHRYHTMRESQQTLALIPGVDRYFPSHDHNDGVSYEELQAYVAKTVTT